MKKELKHKKRIEGIKKVIETMGHIKPTRVNIITQINSSDNSDYLKKEYIEYVKFIGIKEMLQKWRDQMSKDMDTLNTQQLVEKYNVTKRTIYRYRVELGKSQVHINRENRKKLGKLIKTDVKKGYQFCDIKEKYAITGQEVREATKSINYNYNYGKAKELRNKQIIKEFNEGKTYKQIIGKFCDLTSAGGLYGVTRNRSKKRIRNYNLLEPEVIRTIEKGLKKSKSHTMIANKLNKKGFTRADGREYSSVDINNIKVNYKGGELKKYSVGKGKGNFRIENVKRDKKIFKAYKKGKTYKEMATKFNLSTGRISEILRAQKKKQ